MDRIQIINELTNNKKYELYCKKVAKKYHEDIFQDLIVIILEKSEENLANIKCLSCYIFKIIQNLCKSKIGKYKTNDKININEYVDIIVHEEKYNDEIDLIDERVNKEIDNLYWYDMEILKLYIEKGSVRKVSKSTNINYQSIYKTVKKSKEIIIKKIHLED